MPTGTTCGAPGPAWTTTCSPSSTITGNARSSRGRSSRRLGTLGIVGDGIKGYGCPAMATTPEAATPEVDPQQVIDQVFDCAEEMLAVQREFAKSLAATAASATEAARQQSESVVGAVWQPAEDTTEAVPRATKTDI